MPPKAMPTMGTVSAISSAATPTTTGFAWRIAQFGILNQIVSSMRRSLRRRTDRKSILGPSMPNSAGSTATEITAASTTALIAP